MESTPLTIAIVALYIIITTIVGSWSAKYNKDTDTFMKAKNLMGPVVVGFLLMSEFIATGSTMGTAQSAYKGGLAVSWNVISLGLALLLYGLFMAPKFQQLGEYTISGALAKRYGNGTRMVVSIVMIYALVIVTVVAFVGGGAIFATIFGISIQGGVVVIGIASILNVTFGGIRGVGVSNLIHIFFKFVSIIIIAIFGWYMVQKSPEAITRIADNHLYALTGVKAATLISWTFANIGGAFSTQYVVQCISSLNNQQEARQASFVAGIALIPLGLMCTYIGIAARGVFPNIDPVMALPIFLTAMPSWMAGVTIMGIVAVTFVTILACQVGTTALVMADFVIPLLKPNEKSKLRVTRIVCVLVGLLALPFAMYAPGLLTTIFFARALRTSIAVLAVFMFFLPHIGSGRSAAIGLILSVVGTSLWFLMGDPFGIDNVYIAMLLPAIALCIDRLVSGKSEGKALASPQV